MIFLPSSFRSRIIDPPTVAYDDCDPPGIPRPVDEEFERYERAEALLQRAIGDPSQ